MNKKMITVALLVLAASVLPAAADVTVNFVANAGGTTASHQFQIQCPADGSEWVLQNPVTMYNNNNVALGTITALKVSSLADPAVNVFFAFENSTALKETNLIASTTLAFAPITNPLAYATAGVTLTTDDNGGAITGRFPSGIGGKVYEASYNGGTQVFADLVADGTLNLLGPGLTPTASDRFPGSGYSPISGTVSDITGTFNYDLTDGDQISGTSRFEVIVPEPITLSLLVMGGIGMLARRNRKTS